MDYNYYNTHSDSRYMEHAEFAQMYYDLDCVQAKRVRCKKAFIVFWIILLHAESPNKIEDISTWL